MSLEKKPMAVILFRLFAIWGVNRAVQRDSSHAASAIAINGSVLVPGRELPERHVDVRALPIGANAS